MKLVEMAMDMRKSLKTFEVTELKGKEIELDENFEKLVGMYNSRVNMVKGGYWEKKVATAVSKIEAVENAIEGFEANIQKPLLKIINTYQKETKVSILKAINALQAKIDKTFADLQTLKDGESIKDEEGNVIECSKAELGETLTETKKELKMLVQNFKKHKGSASDLKKYSLDVSGVATEKTLANIICSGKGTGIVGSLLTVGDFIFGVIKNNEMPSPNDVKSMKALLDGNSPPKNYENSFCRLNDIALSRTNDTTREWKIDFDAVRNDIEKLRTGIKGSIDSIMKSKKYKWIDIKKEIKKAQEPVKQFLENSSKYCTPNDERLIKLAELACKFECLNLMSQELLSTSGVGGDDTGTWMGIIVVVVVCLVLGSFFLFCM